ncbi:MAG: cyclic nucleotide-binding domain-containing protein [Hydrogenophilales bacterium]|nr:cyclic nucleotide-binding domain-containing protein [Hydrogenophilales bacterium]
MAHAPLISAEMFDYLRNQSIEPYTKLDEHVREQLGDGVRLISLLAGESLSARPGQRINVLSGSIRLQPADSRLDLETTRNRLVLTQAGENRLHAEEDAVVLMAEMDFLDTMATWTELAAYTRHSGGEDLAKRLLHVKNSVAFRRLPLEQVEEALNRMLPRQVKAGEVIVTEGERGDAYYLIWSGRAEVWRTGLYDDEPQMVDTMTAGDAFGDEALVVGGTRNATVKMVEDGELLVLGEKDFQELMSRPLVQEATADNAIQLLREGWVPVDVRYSEEFDEGRIQGAIHLPLPQLRKQADALLDKNSRYITVCHSGRRSAVAAFLLKQRGYEVLSMSGGMLAWAGETVF